MTTFLTFSRYALPILMILIIVKCLIALLFGRPRQNIIAHLENEAEGEELTLEMWETAIGRSRSCDLTIDLPTVSKFHAVIARRVNGWFIYDLKSKNGVSVNGTLIEKKAEIKNNDIISFGGGRDYCFKVDNDPIIKLSKRQLRRMKKEAELRSRPLEKAKTKGRSKTGFDLDDDFFDLTHEEPAPVSKPASTGKPAIVSASGEINYLNGFSVSIGSSGGCIVRLFGGAEPVHANIDLYEDGSWVITNLSKAGSTFLNGVRVTEPQILIEGDRLAFGSNKFTYTERA